MAGSFEAQLKISNDGRIDVEKRIEQLERDRLMLEDELQQLRVFQYELYNMNCKLIPIGQKPKRGRPGLAKKALIRQTI